ncbi:MULTISPECIES: hypothetical protein [Fischerella]|nr:MULTISPECIES: hypothetical protein [Fischerella]BAU07485.1 hypothetical protein FIS3754_34140 [Fischerella sp. NIES-3754]BCX09816.1 MAG: hypothetical protein KatS3mg066_3675 [Fischerella sp.]
MNFRKVVINTLISFNLTEFTACVDMPIQLMLATDPDVETLQTAGL